MATISTSVALPCFFFPVNSIMGDPVLMHSFPSVSRRRPIWCGAFALCAFKR